jgi:hypothetical protein
LDTDFALPSRGLVAPPRRDHEVWPAGLGGPMGDELGELACRARSEGGLGRLNTLLAAGTSTPMETAADELLERARAHPVCLAKVTASIEGPASAVEDVEELYATDLTLGCHVIWPLSPSPCGSKCA